MSDNYEIESLSIIYKSGHLLKNDEMKKVSFNQAIRWMQILKKRQQPKTGLAKWIEKWF